MSLYLGKQDPTYDSRDRLYADVRPKSLSIRVPNPGGGYGMDFGASGWLMLGNGPDDSVFKGFDGCGNCAWAGPGHEHMESNHNAGDPVPPFSGKTIVSQYSEYSGYDAKTGENDSGSNVREVLNWRQKTGLLDDNGKAHKIGPYVALEPGNAQQIWEALYLFEAVGIGIQFPQSAMDQTNAGQMWSVVPGTQIEGGHYIPLFGHPSHDVWTCVTWGQRQTMTQQFLIKYCDEAWAWIDPERYNKVTGETLEHQKDADLEKYLSQLA